MTTATAGNLAGHPDKDKDKEKEKSEKRRALGRGLASLLPGPRVLNPFAKKETTTGAEAPGHSGGDASRPSTVAGAARPVITAPETGASVAAGNPQPGNFVSTPETTPLNRTNVGDAGASPVVSASPAPDVASRTPVANAAELRSAGPFDSAPGGQAGAVVPTESDPDLASVIQSTGHSHVSQHRRDVGHPTFAAGGAVDFDPYGDAPRDGVIEIQAVADRRVPSNLVVNLAIADINKNPFQTRYVEDDDALEELAESIRANGVVQPIVVRPAEEEGRYILILGERRLHASKKIERTHIPALVRRVSEQQAAEMTIVENLQREDLSPLEQAQAFKVLSTQFSLTQDEIAQRVGLSRASIANYMRLLRLPREVMQMLAEKRINFAKAKELLKLGGNDRIAEAALYAVNKGMNIEQVEMLVLRMDGLLDPLPDMPGMKKEKKSSGARWVDPNVRAAQFDLERMLGVRVRIRDRKGRGKIVIEYSTVDDYERVVGMLRSKK